MISEEPTLLTSRVTKVITSSSFAGTGSSSLEQAKIKINRNRAVIDFVCKFLNIVLIFINRDVIRLIYKSNRIFNHG